VDLNRNFPDPDNGPNPDGNTYQPETEIFMALAENVSFDLAMNFHGGAEVFNYPWDTYSQLPADNDWWVHIARQFADACHSNAGDNGYFTDLDNGITNGYAWYPVAGGRQDYMTYFHRAREATLELSSVKLLPPSQFDEVWEYTREPLLNFLHQGRYGLRGTVTDSITGAPLEASITIPGHDVLNSDVSSKLPTGRYHRYLKEDVYTLVYSAEGYRSKSITYYVADNQPSYLHVQLAPLVATSTADLDLISAPISVRYDEGRILLANLPTRRRDQWTMQLLSSDGRQLWTEKLAAALPNYEFSVGSLPSGIYLCRVFGDGGQRTLQFSVVRKKKR